jgi:hypothetical protein
MERAVGTTHGGGADTPTLYHLGYVSTESRDMSRQDLHDILATARRANSERDLTGILLHRQDSFFQVLEGDRDAVHEIFERIRRDSRHHRIKVLFDEPVDTREFAEWQMGFVDLDELDVSQLPGFSRVFEEDTEPRQLLEELSRAKRLMLLFRSIA